MVHKYDTDRAVGLLTQYQANLTDPGEQLLKTSVAKVSAVLGSQLFKALLDIQECYEVTLQLNAEQTVVKEANQQHAWEEGVEEEEGVSVVRVTSRRSPHKVERVSGLVTLSTVDIPEPFACRRWLFTQDPLLLKRGLGGAQKET
ncbi:disks large homolog 1-like isoform X2 [Periophthalmus magnuspinnatus]|uniref:disks large homolog 1-like isoform X2 n=1 Tax=Periophthalmus magnuspinnatus TaxID=409849 RepID=UPI0024371BD2|nr:disks large homolog 1-like isoform X2 [Periophthalmus magnuspinnatus]XP_055080543.1 disks large homolog 1-like isoform X2 [Periophthalmus magnuspinnatus]